MSYHHFGKVNYATIATPNVEFNWYYSYLELQNELNTLCQNHTLKKVYAGLQGYLESFHHSDNYYDFSYLGGSVLLIFDNVAVELCVHGTGMVQCRTMNLWDVKIRTTKDFPPSDMGLIGDRYFYDLSMQFQLTYENQIVERVAVDNVDAYPFSLSGFDEEKAKAAEENNSLPDHVHFHLRNGVDFGVYSEQIEYFYIELKKENTSHDDMS